MMNDFQTTNKNIIQFDSIRFVFALFVLIVHHQFVYANIPSAFAYMAMHTFFIMSAFLITRGLLLSKEKSDSFISFYRNFYFKRMLRIFPVYFAYVFLIIGIGVLTKFLFHQDSIGIIKEIKSFGWMLFSFTYNFREVSAYLNNLKVEDYILFSHLWSLSMEEQFYILIPIVIFILNRKQLLILSILVIILTPLYRIYYFQTTLDNCEHYIYRFLIYYRATFLQFDCFFYGIFLAVYNFNLKNKKLYQLAFWVMLLVYIGVILINGIQFANNNNSDLFSVLKQYDFMILNKQYIYHDVVLNLFISTLFLYSFIAPNFLSFLNIPFIVNSGNKYTYSSYVYQYIFILPLRGILYPFLLKNTSFLPKFIIELVVIMISLSAIYLLSKISYEKLELKFLKLVKK